MNQSVFNPDQQQNDLSSKIVVGLERISEVFKLLLWEKAKSIGLSPIQIQILVFVAFHKPELCNVSHLAKEFNITKPTISDAVKMLNDKGMIEKDYSSADSRSYSISLSALGKKVVAQTSDFSQPLQTQIDRFSPAELDGLYNSLNQLIFKLNRTGLLSVQRTCYGCKFYEKNNGTHYCKLLQKELLNKDIRLDCKEFEAKLEV